MNDKEEVLTSVNEIVRRNVQLEAENAELKRIIAEMKAVDSPDFEKLKELGWTFSLCEICGESLSASKTVIQEGMQRALLEARIDENRRNGKADTLYKREDELRAQLAELG